MAVFDMEGTIFRNFYRGNEFKSIWKILCAECGADAVAKDNANTSKYYSGGYPGYSAWVLDTLNLLKKYGLKRNQFESIINDIDYYSGVAEVFSVLRSQGMIIAVISGGLKALADRVVVDHYIDHCFAAAEIHWNPDGTIRHWNMQPTDFAHKRSVLEILCRDLGISAEDCLFVGDGRNDRAVAGYCALSIGFNPHEELRKDVDIIIEQHRGQEDLAAVLQPILKYPQFSLEDFSSYKIWQCEETPVAKAANLSDSGKRHAYHAFLLQEGLTKNSGNSYCAYLNNLCKNIAIVSWNGATEADAFSCMERAARSQQSEEDFIRYLKLPIGGPHGRANDTTSAARKFFRFVKCY